MPTNLVYIRGGYVPESRVPEGQVSTQLSTPAVSLVLSTRRINTTLPLVGGGDLSLDRTISISKADANTDGYLSKEDWTTFSAGGGGDVPASRTIATTAPLSGGGDLSSNRTLTITQAGASTDGYLTKENWLKIIQAVPNTRTITTSAPLTGGGTLVTDKTFAIPQADVSTDGYLSKEDWAVLDASTPKTRTISTTSPLSGGGDLTTNRTLSIPQADGSTNGFLNMADWTTFNNKVASTRNINTTAPITGGGDLSADRTIAIPPATISADGYLTKEDWYEFKYPDLSGSSYLDEKSKAGYSFNYKNKAFQPAGDWHGVITKDPSGYICIIKGFQSAVGVAAPGTLDFFNGFPNIELFPDGRLMVIWSVAPSHGHDDTAAYYSFSYDGGNSWTTPTELQAGGVSTRAQGLYLVKSGPYKNRLFYCYRLTASTFNRLIYSDDFGETWSDPVDAYDTGAEFTRWLIGGKPVVTGSGDDEILLSGYGYVDGTSPIEYKTTCIASTDGGLTWSRRSVILDGTGINEQPEEPCMTKLQNGNIFCAVREDGNTGAASSSIRTFYSDDDGATWTAIVDTYPGAFQGLGRPMCLQITSGALVLVTRGDASGGYPNFDGIIYTSRDNGFTWDGPVKIDERTDVFWTYGDMIEVYPNMLAFTYGAQNQAYSRSDICFTYLLDGPGRTPLGGIVAKNIQTNNLGAGFSKFSWSTPPAKASATDGATLQTTLNSLIDYLGNIGLVPNNPLNSSSITGLWEVDQIPNTVNDWAGDFSEDTDLDAINGETLSATADGGTWSVTDGKLQNTSPSGRSFLLWDTGESDGEWEADMTWTNDGQIQLVLRYIDTDNQLVIGVDGSALRLYKREGGGSNETLENGTGGTFTNGVEKNLKVVANGDIITCYSGGTLVLTHTLSGGDETTFANGTVWGLKLPSTNARADNVLFHKDLENGDLIGYLPDLSSNGRNLIQTTTADKFIYQINLNTENSGSIFGVFNGLPSIRNTSGNTRYLETASFSAQSQPNAYCVVIWFNNSTGNFFNVLRSASGDAQNLNVTAPSDRKFGIGAGTGAGTTQSTRGLAAGPNAPMVLSCMFDGQSSWIRVNGNYVFRANSSNYVGSGTLEQIRLGDDSNNGEYYIASAAVFAHGSPTTSEIIKYEKYFAQKYDINYNFNTVL
ncbi:MAG: exo-alpha-sialidase [Crenarchaeota archaeon]|nr:MAG: exo-alpha-sialidase [Thermoproteota archaeon]